jgi:hypothetical protein
MPAKRASSTRSADGESSPSAVVDLLASIEHPNKGAFLRLREIILAADPSISEGIKWNSASFRTAEFFATMHLRAKKGIVVILHLGAKKRATAVATIADPAKLLEWLGPDRASVTFTDAADLDARRDEFQALLREWITYV